MPKKIPRRSRNPRNDLRPCTLQSDEPQFGCSEAEFSRIQLHSRGFSYGRDARETPLLGGTVRILSLKEFE